MLPVALLSVLLGAASPTPTPTAAAHQEWRSLGGSGGTVVALDVASQRRAGRWRPPGCWSHDAITIG